jgi:hypothetical protein
MELSHKRVEITGSLISMVPAFSCKLLAKPHALTWLYCLNSIGVLHG